jgi:hypothetical protein
VRRRRALELVEPAGVLRRDILELRPVHTGVVELPHVVVERRSLLADE